MLLAELQNVALQYGAQEVLRGVSFGVSSGQKLGLIGPNGSGKTTILRVLLGIEKPLEGAAMLARGARVGYVPQYVDVNDDLTVMACLLEEHHRFSDALREAEERLARTHDADMPRALADYQAARDAYDRATGDHYPQRARALLDALGLAGREDQKVASLSGGEKNVLSMTRALLEDPDLLVMDEPANHLDYLGVAWLEDFLSRFKGALLIVSHNRYLLDRVVDGILHLDRGRVKYYDGGYSDFQETRLRDQLAQQADYVANQKRLARLEAVVQRLADVARNRSDPAIGKRLRARRSQLEREQAQAVERPIMEERTMKPAFAAEATRGNVALQLRGYSKAFDDLVLFENADVEIACGERVALVGPNGCGKTTLLRDVVSKGSWEHPVIRVGPSLRVGFASQEEEALGRDETVFDVITAAGMRNRKEAANLLARFQFPFDDQRKRVSQLSGGERNRLKLARLMVLGANFLILDEPTNHLDIPSRETVEEALADFQGTILVVSHDRYFLDKIVTRVIEVRDRGLVSYPGNFTEFYFAKQSEAPAVAGRVTRRAGDRSTHARTDRPRAGKNRLAALEKEIEETEARKIELETRITDAFTHGRLDEGRLASQQLKATMQTLDTLYERWLSAGA